MPSNGKQSAATIVSRRFFLAAGSATLGGISLAGNMEGQMTQTKTEPWGRILNGRVAVVTGAARGIGRAAAVVLANGGANVVGIDICAIVDPHSGVEPANRAELDQTGEMAKSLRAMLAELLNDNRLLTANMRSAHELCASENDVATTSLIENWIDETERRTWFLAEICSD